MIDPGPKGRVALVTGRIGQPEDVADVIVFLASEQARWLTGQLNRLPARPMRSAAMSISP